MAYLISVNSSKPPFHETNGTISFDPLKNANLLYENFTREQCDQELFLLRTCFSLPKLISAAFRSNDHKLFLSEFVSLGGTDLDDFFSFSFLRGVPLSWHPSCLWYLDSS